MSSDKAASSEKEEGERKPRKISKPKKTKYGRYASEITKEEVEACFDMPAEDAAVVLGVGSTMLKRISRKFGIRMWPYRKMQINLRREEGAALNQSLYNYNANAPHATLRSLSPAPVPPTENRTAGPESLSIARVLSDKIREIAAAQKASPSVPHIPVIQSKPVDSGVAIPQGQPAQQKQVPVPVPVNTALASSASPLATTTQSTPATVAEAMIREALSKIKQPSPPQKEGPSAQLQPPPPPPPLPAPLGMVSLLPGTLPSPRPVSPLSQAVASPVTVPALGEPLATTNTLPNNNEVGLLNELIGKLHAALVERVENVSLPGGVGGGGCGGGRASSGMPPLPPVHQQQQQQQQRIPQIQPRNALDVLATASASAYQDYSQAAAMPPPPPPQSRPEKTIVEISLLRALATQHVNDLDFVRSTLSKAMLQMLPPPGIERKQYAINHHTGSYSMQQQQQQLQQQQQQQQGFSAWREPAQGRDGRN